MVNNKKINNSLSRKKFLKSSGMSLLALTAASGLAGGVMSGCDEQAGTGNIEVPSWPFPYEKLDPEKAAQRAYDGYQGRVDDDFGG